MLAIAQTFALPIAFADYTLRPLTMDDVETVATLYRDYDHDAGLTNYNFTAEELRQELETPDFDMVNSTMGVFAPDGTCVGVADVWDNTPDPVRIFSGFAVHPTLTGQGLEEVLLAWVDARSQETLTRSPHDAQVVIHSWTVRGYTPKTSALEKAGYTHVRNFYRMRINMSEQPPTPVLPDGLSIRTYSHTDDLQRYVQARLEGFRDHWGFVVQPLEVAMKKTNEWYTQDPLFDQTLCFLVIDDATGEVAAASMCRIEEEADPEVGYVMTLFTRREYRGKGVALAMLHHTFGEFYKRGRMSVALHVDGSSLTGAVRLYEKAGMFQEIVEVTYEKVVRAGKNYMTTHIEE
jgi:mycothiol synthase